MIEILDLQNTPLVERLLALQLASYAIEAELMDFWGIPPLHDTLASLQGCDEIFYGYFIDGNLAGAISYKIEVDTMDIHRLMVAPSYFRRGIASALLNHVETLVPTKIIVSTGTKNLPARRLYTRHGFSEVGTRAVAPDVWITLFEKHSE